MRGRDLVCGACSLFLCLATLAADEHPAPIASLTLDQVFAEPADAPLAGTNLLPLLPVAGEMQPLAGPDCAPAADDCAPANDPACDAALDACDSLFAMPADDCWLHSDQKLLHGLQNQTIYDDVTYSIGGALRFRYIDEANRLRPPVAAGRSSYSQWRFTPYFEVGYKDWVKGYVQAIDASTFHNELPTLIIDENRADLLQMYADLKVLDLEAAPVRLRYGRQFLQYGSQHLISPLAWANTYRNFEGFKLYYGDENWAVDGFAVQPVNGAAFNIYRPKSRDQADQSCWFSGVYATYKKAPNGTLDLYWLWLDEQEDAVTKVDGNRHTIGSRYAGAIPVKDDAGDPLYTMKWDLEGGYQFGKENFMGGINEDVSAGYLNMQGTLAMDSVKWNPSLIGVFWWGSGDSTPGNGTNSTVNTLYPLGHAYWGMMDNFNGQNLLDYSAQASVNPTKKLTLLSAWHWFDKAAGQDAIYNVAGVPFGGVTNSPVTLGNELDLMATYKVNANLELQLGYFWFWYGDAVNQNPNAAVANRNDAEQFYVSADWAF